MFKQVFFIFVLFILCGISTAFAEPIKVSLSQKIVGLNESFTVEFKTREAIGEKPVFSPLLADFDILSSSQGNRTSIINGKLDQENSWTLVLMAKREGKLTIPPVQFGQQHSLPETIEVTTAAPKDQGDPIFLETDLQPKTEAYEQTQLIYTVRLFRSVNTVQATLTEAKVNDPDAIIERLGNDHEYEHYHTDGKRYLVLERKYAVFPQKDGELIFSPIVFEGKVIKGRSSFFDVQGQFMRVSSDEEKVFVKPVPLPFHKHNWFAANDVTLLGEWSADPSNIPLGEPITWTLKLMANGCLGSQIPDVPLQLPSDLRQYPDKPQVENQAKADGFVGVKQIKVVLIPSKAGALTIPEINLKWWDLKTDQLKVATLPATTIQVNDGAVAMNTPSIQQAAIPLQEQQEQTDRSQSLPYWVWCVMGLNVFWIAGLVFVLCKKRKPDPLKSLKSQFKSACIAHDAKQAEAALLAWAGILFPQEKPLNLLKIKPHVPEPFQKALDELYHALYGKKTEWRGEALWKAFIAFKPQNSSRASQKARILRELYPSSH